jgi:large subunit ribosomal protein L1
MNKQDVLNAIKKAKEISNKKNFKQSVDLIITLQDLDLKKPDNQVDFFMSLPFSNRIKTKVCGLVGPEMIENAKKDLDLAISSDDFEIYEKDKKKIKKLANECDFFIAQANLMGQIAKLFGRVFGPKNKMPNPKSGCVVPPNANLGILKTRLGKTIRITVKTSPQIQIALGKEDIKEDDLAENAIAVYSQVIHHLPNENNNIKDSFIKLTMGPTIKIGLKEEKEGNKK